MSTEVTLVTVDQWRVEDGGLAWGVLRLAGVGRMSCVVSLMPEDHQRVEDGGLGRGGRQVCGNLSLL